MLVSSMTFGASGVWVAVAAFVLFCGFLGWCLCAAAADGDRRAEEAWGKPFLRDVHPVGTRVPRETPPVPVGRLPRRFRVIEGALDVAGSEVEGLDFDWPETAA